MKDRRFTQPNTKSKEYGGYENIEQIMSSRIQAARASRVNIEGMTSYTSNNRYGDVS